MILSCLRSGLFKEVIERILGLPPPRPSPSRQQPAASGSATSQRSAKTRLSWAANLSRQIWLHNTQFEATLRRYLLSQVVCTTPDSAPCAVLPKHECAASSPLLRVLNDRLCPVLGRPCHHHTSKTTLLIHYDSAMVPFDCPRRAARTPDILTTTSKRSALRQQAGNAAVIASPSRLVRSSMNHRQRAFDADKRKSSIPKKASLPDGMDPLDLLMTVYGRFERAYDVNDRYQQRTARKWACRLAGQEYRTSDWPAQPRKATHPAGDYCILSHVRLFRDAGFGMGTVDQTESSGIYCLQLSDTKNINCASCALCEFVEHDLS